MGVEMVEIKMGWDFLWSERIRRGIHNECERKPNHVCPKYKEKIKTLDEDDHLKAFQLNSWLSLPADQGFPRTTRISLVNINTK
jgi:hypothetical protein